MIKGAKNTEALPLQKRPQVRGYICPPQVGGVEVPDVVGREVTGEVECSESYSESAL